MKNILILEPSSSGLELLLNAKKLGLGTIIFSADTDERIIPNEYFQYIDFFLKIDTYDKFLLSNIIKNINEKIFISAIIPGSEYHVPTAAYLANSLKLPGVNIKNVKNLRLKNHTRKSLKKYGLKSPKFTLVKNIDDLKNASYQIGFPSVLKPVGSAGSMHVTRANSFDELLQLYEAMVNDPWSELGIGIGRLALVEEYIEGEEFSVEGFIQNTQSYVISITKKFLTSEPLFIEIGHIVPAKIDNQKAEIITAYVQEVIKALGINMGIFHAELRIDKDGHPVLIEIAGRLPGGRICELIHFAKGLNLYQIMIYSHLGIDIKFESEFDSKIYAGMCYFDLKGKTKFNTVHGIEKIRKLSGFQEFKLLKKSNEQVSPLTTFQGRVATCIFTGSSYETVVEKLDKAKELISFS